MKNSYEKYIPFPGVKMEGREWPSKAITKAPAWCSVDLRDGNQALVDPMDLEEKLQMFQMLVKIGFKEIEIGFPSASDTEFEITRRLIEGGYIPDDVAIQVLVQSRPHLIKRTFDAVRGAKNVIIHFYNSTSPMQRKIVFRKDMDGIVDIAVKGAQLIAELSKKEAESGTNIQFEYSPESFSQTEPDFAVRICSEVMRALGASPEHKVILNLPNTVECCMPNGYADEVEYFCRHLPNRESAVISVHPHNDRGTGVAAAEFAMLAGAQRVEGTLFGNGERTGNVDLVTVALNMYTQGVDPKLDFHDIPKIRSIYEKSTHMKVPPRQPYAGDLVFTAFSGSHQDAISKGMSYMRSVGSDYWEVPYLPIDPKDVGREYEPVIRINSQSGKGGASYVLETGYGYKLPKAMQPEFGAVVKKACDKASRELEPDEIFSLFKKTYFEPCKGYGLRKYSFENLGSKGGARVAFRGEVEFSGRHYGISGTGNGPVDAFFSGLAAAGVNGYRFISYDEQALSKGSDSKAVAYVRIGVPDGKEAFGVGVDDDISAAAVKAVICAMARADAAARA